MLVPKNSAQLYKMPYLCSSEWMSSLPLQLNNRPGIVYRCFQNHHSWRTFLPKQNISRTLLFWSKCEKYSHTWVTTLQLRPLIADHLILFHFAMINDSQWKLRDVLNVIRTNRKQKENVIRIHTL